VITQLRGVLVSKQPTSIVVDVHGVGYRLDIPVSTYETLGATGREVTLLTHLVVRDDSMQLYGFSSENERELFGLFLSVSGIGPRLALSLLSRSSCDELRRAIAESDLDSLTAVSGIGKKTAQRLVVELKEKIGTAVSASSPKESSVVSDAVRALMSLGYTRAGSLKAVRAAAQGYRPEEGVEELVRRALALAGK